MVLSQNISISLSIIALAGLVGAGVAVGSGVGELTAPPHSARLPPAQFPPLHAIAAAPASLLIHAPPTLPDHPLPRHDDHGGGGPG